MSCVKEEREDVSVMEASGLKTEDEEVETGTVLQEDVKEEFTLEVEPFEEECAAQKTDQTAQHERSSTLLSQQPHSLRDDQLGRNLSTTAAVGGRPNNKCTKSSSSCISYSRFLDFQQKDEEKDECLPPRSCRPSQELLHNDSKRDNRAVRTPLFQWWYGPKGREKVFALEDIAMSCVKEECEDISVMEVSELKTEDEEVKDEAILQEDIKEEYEVEVKPFQEESGLKTEQETSSGDALDPNDHLRIHTCGEKSSTLADFNIHMMIHTGDETVD
ncbi:hypothetical protein MHYP_G00106220 [Metynnis hypsauchen]